MAPTKKQPTPPAYAPGRLRLQLCIAAGLALVGAALLIAGLAIPPQGEIHYSVLIAVGEILTFVGSTLGIDYHYKAKTTCNSH